MDFIDEDPFQDKEDNRAVYGKAPAGKLWEQAARKVSRLGEAVGSQVSAGSSGVINKLRREKLPYVLPRALTSPLHVTVKEVGQRTVRPKEERAKKGRRDRPRLMLTS